MYRWNSRVPTVRWKDNCLSDSRSATSATHLTTEDKVVVDTRQFSTSGKTNIYSEKKENSSCCNINCSSTASDISARRSGGVSDSNSSEVVGGGSSGGNLSGSTLTSTESILLGKEAVEPHRLNASFSPSLSFSENPLCNFDTTTLSTTKKTFSLSKTCNSSSTSSTPTATTLRSSPLLSTSTTKSTFGEIRSSLEITARSSGSSSSSDFGIIPTSDDEFRLDEKQESSGSTQHLDWNVIRTFFSFVGFAVREIRTLSFALLIGLLVNPINYCICSFSPSSRFPAAGVGAAVQQPLFSSIRTSTRILPGGSSTTTTSYYYCCKRRKRNIISGGVGSSSSSNNIITSAFTFLLRLPCFCTCNCISFLRPILLVTRGNSKCEYCSVSGGAAYKDNRTTSSCGCSSSIRNNSASTSTSSTAHQHQHRRYSSSSSSSGKSKRGLGKMAQILSKTMTLLGVAFVIHFIIMSTFAEKEGLIPQPRFSASSSSDGSKKYHFHHHYHDELETGAAVAMNKRLARSYRHDKHPTPAPSTSADANVLSSLTGHNSRLPTNKSEAVFSTENSTVIIAQIGSKTYLPCAVRNLGSGVASWIRRRDYHLLTVGMGTYSNDDRFLVSHNRPAQSWELHIKFVKPSDEGIYECQISTHPPSSIFVHLRVVEAKAEILGEPDKHVRSGSTFELVCVLRDSTEPPVYVFWYHNDRMINYDNVRGVQVSSDAEKSILTIQEAQKSDSGNYTCVPSNARPTSISVHILNGEKPAAMQHGSRSHSSRLVPSFSVPLLFVTAFVVFLLTAWLATTNQSQQNLFHLHHHHHQYKQEEEEEKEEEEEGQKKRCYRCVPDTTTKLQPPPPQQKVCTMKTSKEKDEITAAEIHWKTRRYHHHLYLRQLLRRASVEFGDGVYNDDDDGDGDWDADEKKEYSHTTSPISGGTSLADNIKRNSVTTILCIWLLVQVSRKRAVEICSKSNLKKPQAARSCPNGLSSSATKNNATTTTTPSISNTAMIKSFPLNGARRLAECSPVGSTTEATTTVGKYSVLKNNNNNNNAYYYDHCYPRQVVNVGKGESETELHTTAAAAVVVTSVDDIAKVDQSHHIHASLVFAEDIQEKRIVSLLIITTMRMMKRREQDERAIQERHIYLVPPEKWNPPHRDWVDHVIVLATAAAADDHNENATAFKPELCGNSEKSKIYMCAGKTVTELVDKHKAQQQIIILSRGHCSSITAKAIAPGVAFAAFQPVTATTGGGEQGKRIGGVDASTTFSTKISSLSFPLSPYSMTFPKNCNNYNKRFMTSSTTTTTGIIIRNINKNNNHHHHNNPTLTKSHPPENNKQVTFKVATAELLGKSCCSSSSSLKVFCIVVDSKDFVVVVPVQVIVVIQVVVVTTNIVIRRKQVDSSLHHRRQHHHHHFSVLFPSACSYYYSLTTSGLLVSCFPFLLISSSLILLLPVVVAAAVVVATPRIMPTTTTTPTSNSTTTTTMSTSTTSFQLLFSLRNKAEEEDCLPQLLVKRLLRQPTTPPSSTSSSSSPLEYYSVTVPTTNNNNKNNNDTYKLPNILGCTSYTTTTTTSFPSITTTTAQTVAR